MESTISPRKAVIVGAGPVGCLCAMSLAKMGWIVEVYEGCPDMRLPSSKAAAQQRSINLAMSSRGIAAIHAIDPGAGDRFLRAAIPMRGRMIHDSMGNASSQFYDRDGQFINSIDRALLNEDLLEEALAVPNITVFFSKKILSIDFDSRFLNVQDVDSHKNISVPFDLCVGADGTYSIVRRQLMRVVRMDYMQEYIPHEYIELKMPPGPPSGESGEPTFQLDPNHLHIWPRHSFMLIALPNKDKSFTCTLFAPTEEFAKLASPEATLEWFRAQFPDAVALIGEDALLHDFEKNPRCSLMSIKAKPYHYKDCAIILGDAAHSMVPFYGQGLNCGLEDVRVLDLLLHKENVDPRTRPQPDEQDSNLTRALQQYSDSRYEDLITISDLAMDNYTEMAHSVTTPSYLFRKALDNILYSLSSQGPSSIHLTGSQENPFPTKWPGGWLPQYTMVTFRPDVSYATVKRKITRQNEILNAAGWVGAVLSLT
ncbi:Kynurenine 3-monooxygenase [Abortiporus biennis]